MAITWQIIDQSGGKVTLANMQPNGLRQGVVLPARQLNGAGRDQETRCVSSARDATVPPKTVPLRDHERPAPDPRGA
ncbi:hypothetical protein GIY56_01945 [Paracoccus sp. YIM 132242]|uniref:Uncharacterized protein n=1 Tax=Paracoccus lichenicola TaxID=2665644 RepID=A0A6L6HIQ8_9RHOB|nr:hypothetical protein [Paracoccus lichenicola]MTD99046.1 hypothetical protein [Paracoccus lichenicola]